MIPNTLRIVAGAAAIGLALAACGNDSSQGDSNSGTARAVTVWLPAGPGADLTSEFLIEWGPEHNIETEVVTHPGAELQETIELAAKTKQGPDIALVGQTSLLRGGLLLPLDDVISDQNMAEYGPLLEGHPSYRYKGNVYTMPTTVNTTRLAFNKEIFQQAGLDPADPPANVGEIRDACEAIAANAPGKYCFGLPLAWNGFPNWMVEPLVAVTDHDLTVNGMFDLSEQRHEMKLFEPVIELYREMIQKGWAYPGASSLDIGPMRAAFANGEIAMFVSASWDNAAINDKLKTQIDWAVAPMPASDGDAVRGVMNAGARFQILKDSDEPEAAGEVLNALIGRERMQRLTDAGLVFPLRDDVTLSENLSPQYEDYLRTEDDEIWRVSPEQELQLQGETRRQLVLRLILESDPIASALADLDKTYDGAYEKGVDQGLIDATEFSAS